MSSERRSQIPTMIIRDFPFYGMEPFSREKIESLLNFQPKNNDLIFCSYPMGSIEEITVPVWKLQNPSSPLPSEFFFQNHACPLLDNYGDTVMMLSMQKRLMRINLPYHLTPKNEKTKFLYVVKNPQDVILGSFDDVETLLGRDLCFDKYFDDFVAGRLPYGDFFDHVLSWYEHRDDPNVLLVSHDKMVRNRVDEIAKVAEFLQISLMRMRHDRDFFEKNFATIISGNIESADCNESDSSPITQDAAAGEKNNPESDDSTESSEGCANMRPELTIAQKVILQRKINEKFGMTDIPLMWINEDEDFSSANQ